jgi:hypothetical protein
MLLSFHMSKWHSKVYDCHQYICTVHKPEGSCVHIHTVPLKHLAMKTSQLNVWTMAPQSPSFKGLSNYNGHLYCLKVWETPIRLWWLKKTTVLFAIQVWYAKWCGVSIYWCVLMKHIHWVAKAVLQLILLAQLLLQDLCLCTVAFSKVFFSNCTGHFLGVNYTYTVLWYSQ